MKQDYSIPELIQNSSFRRVVTGAASLEEIAYWDRWMEEKDVNKQKVQKAIPEIIGFAIKQPQQPDIDGEWDKLQKDTVDRPDHMIPGRFKKETAFKWGYRVAAVLLLGTILGLGFYTYADNTQPIVQLEQITKKRTIQTGANEQKKVSFSNGSKVTLNNNSVITYKTGSSNSESINIVLEGEAYFETESDSEQTEPVFAVHTPDGVVRDIGTEFLVTVKHDRSRVVLQEGKVEVSKKGQRNSAVTSVEKDEMLEFGKSKVLKKRVVNPTFYTSWATGAMEFDKTTLNEFSRFVEERFDVEVCIVEPDIGEIKMDGGVYFESLEELVRSISEVTKVPVYQSENRKTIYIGDGDEYTY